MKSLKSVMESLKREKGDVLCTKYQNFNKILQDLFCLGFKNILSV